MVKITEKRARASLERYLNGHSTEKSPFHVSQPYLFGYIYLDQEKLIGREREILRTFAAMTHQMMSEHGEVPLVTRYMLSTALAERKRSQLLAMSGRDDSVNITIPFNQYSLYSVCTTFLFKLLIEQKDSLLKNEDNDIMFNLLSDIKLFINLFDNAYLHKKQPHNSDNEALIADKVADKGGKIIAPLWEKFRNSSEFETTDPLSDRNARSILSLYAGYLKFIHQSDPESWREEALKIFLNQRQSELCKERFALEKKVIGSFIRFMRSQGILSGVTSLFEESAVVV